jgi:hypothetical protein
MCRFLLATMKGESGRPESRNGALGSARTSSRACTTSGSLPRTARSSADSSVQGKDCCLIIILQITYSVANFPFTSTILKVLILGREDRAKSWGP